MKILLVVKQKKNVDTFLGTIGCLLDRGHWVTAAVQERDEERDESLARDFDPERFAVVRCPSARTGEWAGAAALLRSLRDCVHYLRPQLRGAVKLQTRTVEKLRQELIVPPDSEHFVASLRQIPAAQVSRLEAVLKLAERSLPADALSDEFIRSQAPDLLLLSPLVHFGSAQADLVASARRLGVPIWMLLFSWDNLSTKGCLHQWPDGMFVWNERQRGEANALHGFPPERVVVVGAPRFDAFFELRSQMSREAFHQPLGLDPAKPTLLYVCSSRFVSDGELAFIRRWVKELRGSGSAALRECNILVRPHPDVSLLPPEEPVEKLRQHVLPTPTALVARPFGDPRAIVLRTGYSEQVLYESIWQSAAVVGLNTSAELEAGIVGRPVFTILADEQAADGQHTTLHFHYLLKEHGGIVEVGRTFPEHMAQLDGALRQPVDPAPIRAFIQEFLRPHGIETPVSPLLAEAIEQVFIKANDSAPSTAIATAPAAMGGAATATSGSGVPATGEDHREPIAPEPVGDDVVPLVYHSIRISAYATPEVTRLMKGRGFAFDAGTVHWLEQSVGIGDVVYDIGAGVGVYTLVAATQRAAVVVAFEAGYASYGRLCDNLLLNGCDGRVIPVPLELSDRDGLKELKYQGGRPGQDRHTLSARDWRVRPSAAERAYPQPVCTMPLDAAIARHGLPAPNHLRLSRSAAAPAVLAGATATLAAPALKSVFVAIEARDADAVVSLLRKAGWDADDRQATSAETVHLRFQRR